MGVRFADALSTMRQTACASWGRPRSGSALVPVQQERRLSKRKTLERVTYIDLPSHNGGIVIDVSEGGLCFHAIAPVENGGPIHFTFSGGSQPIAGMGELMWTGGKGQIGGLRFTELPKEIREQIRKWPLESNLRFSAAKDSPRNVPATDRAVPAAPTIPAIPEASAVAVPAGGPVLPHVPVVPALPKSAVRASANAALGSYAPYFPAAVSIETPRGKRAKRSSRLVKAIGITGLAGFIGVASYLCYREARWWMTGLKASGEGAAQGDRQSPLSAAPTTMAQASAAQGTSQAQDARPARAQSPAAPQTPAGASQTIFVQVAAYTREADALNLVYTLRGQDFIASVSPPTTDAYYRVQLGPYTTMDAAQIGKRELEKAGFEAFIRH